MKLDILVIAAHPDDAELACSGTIAKHIALGKKVGILDLTQGEMGTRGTPELRMVEAAKSAKILGLSARENAHFKDVKFAVDNNHIAQLVTFIRKYQPEIVLANAIEDRHPDHGKGGELASKACFISGLKKFETQLECKNQEAWRPKALYHYIQDRYINPDFVVDITPFWDIKINSIKAFSSQFFNPESTEEETYISKPDFLNYVESRAREFGHHIGATFAEGFTKERHIGVNNLFDLI
jgi:N-acetylglucosamine malate deacetylase 1